MGIDKSKVLELLSSDLTYAEIGERFGGTKDYVRTIARAAGHKRAHRRGFASMDPERRRAIAIRGGAGVPAHKRSFSAQDGLAAEAGRKGGLAPHARRPGRPRKIATLAAE